MKIIKGFGTIFFFLFLGTIVTRLVESPIPDTVFGMIFLFLALNFKLVKVEEIDQVATSLVSLIAFFLIPPAVSFVSSYDVIKADALKIILLILLSTIITMTVTALVVNALQGGKKNA